MEGGINSVCCPVCTLFMREGVSLESHLNTHPKEQVIEALLRYCANGSNVAERNISSVRESLNVPQAATSQSSDQSVIDCAPASVQTTQYPVFGNEQTTQYPSFGSSHFTAAITYQQFLSSNASTTGSVIPQYVSVPTILTTPNSAHGEASQTALMPVLYNPYLLQQQQQVQFYDSVRAQPPQQQFLRQILPSPLATPAPLFPVPQHLTFTSNCSPVSGFQQGNNCSTSSGSALQTSRNTQTTNSLTTSSILSVTQVTASNESTTAHQLRKDDSNDDDCKETPSSIKSNSVSPKSPQSNISLESKNQQRTINKGTTGDDSMNSQNSAYETTVRNTLQLVPLSDNITTDSTKHAGATGTSYEDFSPYDKTEDIDDVESIDDQTVNAIENEVNQQDNSLQLSRTETVSPGLRVRTDLNGATMNADQECNFITEKCVLNEVSKVHSKSNVESNEVSDISCTVMDSDDASDLSKIIRGELVIPLSQTAVDNNEYITSDCPFSGEFNENQNQEAVTTQQSVLESGKESNKNSLEDSEASNKINFDTSRQVNIIEIDGVHILVPSQFVGNSTGVLDRKVTVIQSVCEPASTSTGTNVTKVDEDISKLETETPNLVNLDMQANEMMPPRGELSEQESVGGNDNPVWVQAFQERDEDVSTSYDLLARESWEASDGSDVEGCNDIVVENTTEHKSTESLLEKKKDKPTTVYKCWCCGEEFNCPKERRVHQAHKHPRETECSNIKLKSKYNLVVKGKHKYSKVKEESQEDSGLCVKSEPAQFAQVFVESHQQAKLEEVGVNSGMQGNENVCATEQVDNNLDDQQPVKEETSVVKYACTICEEIFTNAKCLQRHLRTLHREFRDSKHTCSTCKQQFSTETLYHAHLKIHPLECTRCGKYFYRRQNLNLHVKRHLGIKPFKCAICDKAFVTKQKLAEHTNSHTGNSPLKCSLCSKSFRRYSNLIQHRNRYHLKLKKKVKDFICHCGEVFHSKKKLEWHKEIHDEKPKSCMFCSERFVHAASLTRHVRRAHDERYVPKNGRENENVECPICACIFMKSSLHVHMRVHSGERPFQCQICGKGFTTKWNLQLHRWTHASRSTKPFKCTLCKSAFFRHCDYTAHMHSHRNERPYTCNYCGCQFIRKYNCLRHVKEHEAVKSFACSVCNKTFHRSCYLKEHMRIHSGVRPFACHICGKASSTKSNHNKHVKIHHAREPVNTEG